MTTLFDSLAAGAEGDVVTQLEDALEDAILEESLSSCDAGGGGAELEVSYGEDFEVAAVDEELASEHAEVTLERATALAPVASESVPSESAPPAAALSPSKGFDSLVSKITASSPHG